MSRDPKVCTIWRDELRRWQRRRRLLRGHKPGQSLPNRLSRQRTPAIGVFDAESFLSCTASDIKGVGKLQSIDFVVTVALVQQSHSEGNKQLLLIDEAMYMCFEVPPVLKVKELVSMPNEVNIQCRNEKAAPG